MLFAMYQQQSDECVVDLNSAAATAGLWLFQRSAESPGFFHRTLNLERLFFRIEVRPLQTQDFIATCARERRQGYDRVERLLVIEDLSALKRIESRLPNAIEKSRMLDATSRPLESEGVRGFPRVRSLQK